MYKTLLHIFPLSFKTLRLSLINQALEAKRVSPHIKQMKKLDKRVTAVGT